MRNRINRLLAWGVCAWAMPVFPDVIDGEELVDPTRPIFIGVIDDDLDRQVPTMIRSVIAASYDVSFVRASGTSPMAIVNEQRVTIGDVIGGATVVAIDRSGVTLSIDDEERRISIYGSNVKAPVVNQ